MRREILAPLMVVSVLAAAPACHKATTAKVVSKSETKSTSPDGGRTTTTTETKQIGSTIASTTETTSSGAGRRGKMESETVVGTVTEAAPGRKLVVMTGDGSKHSWDLDDKKMRASLDPRVTVGTKVRVEATKDGDGNRTVRAVPVSDR